MKDKNKTREQLINELTGLRQRLAGSQALEARCKKAKQALRESENKYRQLFLAETDAIVLFDAETLQFIDINNAAQSLYGYTKEEFLKLKIQDISAEVEETIGSIAKTCQGNVTRIRCRYHRKKDGTVFPVEISPGFFKLRDYKVICGVIRDISERKMIEETLRDSEQKFKSIFDAASDGIILADRESKKFHNGNKKIYQMLGYSPEEFRNLGVMDIHPKEDIPHVLRQFEEQLKKKITLAKNIRVERKDGSIFYADISTSPITLAGTKYLMGSFRDITESKKNHDALKQKMRDLERFSKFAVDRELKMEELEEKVKELEERLKSR